MGIYTYFVDLLLNFVRYYLYTLLIVVFFIFAPWPGVFDFYCLFLKKNKHFYCNLFFAFSKAVSAVWLADPTLLSTQSFAFSVGLQYHQQAGKDRH